MHLSIQNLRKVYQDGKVALDGFNWELDTGIYGLLGPNGAGKSTLLEILSLGLMPTSGRVLWDGWDIEKRPNAFRRQLGYLPQIYGFYPEMKARQVLDYLGRLHGLHGRGLKNRIMEVIELVNMTRELNRRVKTFSGGMRQRLAIAQSLLHKPQILVIDEPTTGLDPGERVAFRNMLFDLGRTCIVLLSTHIVKDVEFSCQQMTLLYGGIQRFAGLPADFMKGVDGRVFETKIPFHEFQQFTKEHHVIAIQERMEEITVRFITQEKSTDVPGAQPVRVNLEDAYVDFIRQCGKAEDLSEDID